MTSHGGPARLSSGGLAQVGVVDLHWIPWVPAASTSG